MKKTIIIVIAVVVVVVAGLLIWNWSNQKLPPTPIAEVTPPPAEPTSTATTTPQAEQDKTQTVIGKSVGGNDIVAYHYGTGVTEILFVGGIHGGYEWNTALVAQQLADYLKANPDTIPQGVKVTVIPVLNPDGLAKVTGSVTANFTAANVATSQATLTAGRFNGHNVDLNRNFDCDWQATGTWQNKAVSGGTAPFSEPESQALRDYVAAHKPAAALAWYSSAGGVYASSCGGSILPETRTLLRAYAKASGYPAYDNFNAYKVTGDMVDWLAKSNVPAISVLLTNHQDTEWAKNLAGVKALLQYYAK